MQMIDIQPHRLGTPILPVPSTQTRTHLPPSTWHPDSWRSRPITQQPDWPDPVQVERVTEEIALQPPLVLPDEIGTLQRSLAAAAEGNAFLLQAGDCAERFSSCTEHGVRSKLRVILQLAILLTYGSGLPVVKVGRIGGQFAKPRSKPTEVIDGIELPAYRGDIVNSPEPTPEARRPDVERLMRAYHHSSATLNVLRALTTKGFADLEQVHEWNTEFVRRSPAGQHYEQVADNITWALRFMQACGMNGTQSLRQVHFYTSHEALLPHYEQALTRYDKNTGAWFDTSAHMVWIGDRTRQLDGAHVEFLSGIANPIGLKVGPTTTPCGLRDLVERLDPDHVPGRLVLISRMGADRVTDLLPPLLRAVRSTGRSVVWACDPMHGNTFVSKSGYKTRSLCDITREVVGFFEAHKQEGVHPGGLHLELTGDNVTECLGGAEEVLDTHLCTRYETACDPRLNASQSIELAFRVANMLREHRGS
ncbi:class II 3-deoxy-7-phosphoheptulonate synthase [Actinosynnema sp. ALI-1.44]|uniref:class II 3-deoxy-7-phosphoheptulonate synthase n=1 Tax=Actinosynnema sp. ALI-1.44 TaxID=1933779 RepID=UPI0011785FE0|nr:3-deoxy-7-phosphoheptulonate synthase class II [Actinosynnema sp. ALI-1.44]